MAKWAGPFTEGTQDTLATGTGAGSRSSFAAVAGVGPAPSWPSNPASEQASRRAGGQVPDARRAQPIALGRCPH